MIDRIRRYAGLLREPPFRRLWLAQSISQFGTQVTSLALPLVAILVLNASAFEVAILGGLEFLPFLLLTLPAGVWVDRLPRKRILVIADVGRAINLAVIPVATVAGALAIWQLYVVAIVSGSLSVFFDVAYQAILPELVGRDRLAEGNSRLEISRSAAQVLGPGIGGYLVGVLTAPIAVLVDAASYLASASFLFGLRPRSSRASATANGPAAQPSGGLRREMAEGLRFYRRSRVLLASSATVVTSNFASTIVGSIFLVFVVRELGMTPESIGLALSLASIGTLVGAATAQAFGRRVGIGHALLVVTAVGTVSQLAYVIATPETAFWVLVIVGFAQGIAWMTFNVLGVSLRQAITPDELQGRVNATGRWLNWSAIPVATVLGGILGSVIGLRPTILIGGLIGLIAIPWLAIAPIRSIREMPHPFDAEPSAAATVVAPPSPPAPAAPA